MRAETKERTGNGRIAYRTAITNGSCFRKTNIRPFLAFISGYNYVGWATYFTGLGIANGMEKKEGNCK